MAKRKKSEKQRAMDKVTRLLADYKKLETDIGKSEDELGLARSNPDEPWDERIRRIHERREQLK